MLWTLFTPVFRVVLQINTHPTLTSGCSGVQERGRECELYTSELQLEHCSERFFLLEGLLSQSSVQQLSAPHLSGTPTTNNLKPAEPKNKILQYI